MLHERFEPKRLCEVRGNDKAKRDLVASLRSYDTHSGVMIAGPPGVGKDVAVRCACRELNYGLEEVQDLKHLRTFYAQEDRKDFPIEAILFSHDAKPSMALFKRRIERAEHDRSRLVLFIRDLDSFAAVHAGAPRAICSYLGVRKRVLSAMGKSVAQEKRKKKTPIPPPPLLVITCNDAFSYKSIKGHCIKALVRFYPVEVRDVCSALVWTIGEFRAREKKEWCWPQEYDKECCQEVASSSQGDVRNTLIVLYTIYAKLVERMDDDDYEVDLTAVEDEISQRNMSLFDAADTLFQHPGPYRADALQDKLSVAFQDPYRLPAMVHENYAEFAGQQQQSGNVETLKALSRCADSISYADTLEECILSTQVWSLQPHQLIAGCVVPTLEFHRPSGKRRTRTRLRFPSSFTFSSTLRKHSGELARLRSVNIRGDATYLFTLASLLMQPMLRCCCCRAGSDSTSSDVQLAVSETVDRMRPYGLSRNLFFDLLSLVLGDNDRYNKLPARVKAAFTRKITSAVKVQVATKKKKTSSSCGRRRSRPPGQEPAPPPQKRKKMLLFAHLVDFDEDEDEDDMEVEEVRPRPKGLLRWMVKKK